MNTGELPGLVRSGSRLVEAERARTARRASAVDRRMAAALARVMDPVDVRLELWDGTSVSRVASPVGSLIVRDRRVLIGLLLDPEMSFGEGYASGRIEVEGGLEPVIEALSRSASAEPCWRDRLARSLSLPTTLHGARRNVQHHYDLGNDFYQLWLDRQLVYTCAYFPTPAASLEEAQVAKMDLVCRKLRLRAGERVIEAGCGWGALALHMARDYGVRVHAFNVSREQLSHARTRAAREGLSGRVEFIDDDYRNVTGRYDAFVSVGMLEHVGLSHYPTLGQVLRRSLRPDGGRGLLHFIGRDVPRPLSAWIRRRIFPGGYTPTLAEVFGRVLGPAGQSVIDVENLRLHYARTLAHWGARFARARNRVVGQYGEEFARSWELYLAGSQAAFETGWLQLFQIVFTPRESRPPYWCRTDACEAGGAR